MSLEAYTWAASLPLNACSATAYRVLLMLADRVDPIGYTAWPSVVGMAETLQCSARTVQRGIRELLDAGLIRKGDQQFVAHIRPDRRPTVYDLLTPALVYLESRGDTSVTPSDSRGDRFGPHGVTTVVARTVLKPSYQDFLEHPTLVTARESVMSR